MNRFRKTKVIAYWILFTFFVIQFFINLFAARMTAVYVVFMGIAFLIAVYFTGRYKTEHHERIKEAAEANMKEDLEMEPKETEDVPQEESPLSDKWPV